VSTATASRCFARRATRVAFAALSIVAAALAPLLAACDRSTTAPRAASAPGARPNILLVVWDAVRSDRLSLYGHDRQTTPFLDAFAGQARVFDNCLSVASNTVPAHASIFTGLLPVEHGVTNEAPFLADDFETLAELLKAAGYRTCLFSENPHICTANHFTQGFDVAEHPWSAPYAAQAVRITQSKLDPSDVSSELSADFARRGKVSVWSIKAAGLLAQQAVVNWLAQQPPDQPWFVFINYMEAHRPLIPPRHYRLRLLTPDEVEASYRVDRRWLPMWSYVFGLHEYTPEEIRLTQATYDAALLELDELFHNLLEGLRAAGRLENTAVVLVADHGEHLGEHHRLDHQYSVYEPLLRVPLVVHYPRHFVPGRETRPVMNLDLFPTLLELAGINPPARSGALSLLQPRDQRPRLAEYPAVMLEAITRVQQAYPDHDLTPWKRTLRAWYAPPCKFIEASDGRHELYNLSDDPAELHNLIDLQPDIAQRLATELRTFIASLRKATPMPPPAGPVEDDQRRRLRMLGYLEPE